MTDDEDSLNRSEKWDRTTGTGYTYEVKPDGKGNSYNEVWIKDVPASEMAVRYATLYIEYVDENGTECHAYSKTVKYGVITYLNNQIAEMTKTGVPTEDADLKMLYLWGQLRTVATFAENSKN